jgi:hypothetical protein
VLQNWKSKWPSKIKCSFAACQRRQH